MNTLPQMVLFNPQAVFTYEIALAELKRLSVSKQQTLYKCSMDTLLRGVVIDELTAFLKTLGFFLAQKDFCSSIKKPSAEFDDVSENLLVLNYISDDSVLVVSVDKDKAMGVSVLSSLDEKVIEQILQYFKPFAKESEVSATSYYITVGSAGYQVHKLGELNKRANKDYYNNDVWDSFSDWVSSYSTANARLNIITGNPGTGKTHLLYESAALNKSLYHVFIDSATFRQEHKSVVNALIGNKNSKVLIIEDGDALIAKRTSGNREAIEYLLNMTDGVLGEALKIRVIVTTNLLQDEIDEAVLRPGRCYKMIEVSDLTEEKFSAISAQDERKKGTLAEALNAPPLKRKEKLNKIGFSSL